MTRVRFYDGDTPIQEFSFATVEPPRPGSYMRFAPFDACPAYYVEAVCHVYNCDNILTRIDVALSAQHPRNMPPFPQITRTTKEFVPIPSLEPPPEEIQHAEAVNNKKGRQHRGVDRQSNPDAREEGKGAGDIAPGAGDHPHRG
jgi:hypothetical protein